MLLVKLKKLVKTGGKFKSKPAITIVWHERLVLIGVT